MRLLTCRHILPFIPPFLKKLFTGSMIDRNVLTALSVLSLLLPGEVAWTGPTQPTDPLMEARSAFDGRQYEQTLHLVEPLLAGEASAPDAHRLKIKSLVRLERPVEALAEYDRLEAHTGRDERQLLREIAIGFITVLLKDMREQMRGAAYTALKEWDSDEAVPYLEDGLSDGAGLVRALAVEGLGRLASGRHSARLRKAVEDPAAIVRTAALKVLGRSGDRSTIALVKSALQDEQPTVRVAAAGALVKLGRTEALARVKQAVEARNPEERAAGLRMLGDLRNREALPILQKALKDDQPSVRGAAAAALGDLGVPLREIPLETLLNDPIPAVRAAAAVSLGELRAPDSVPALKHALTDGNPAVRAAAISALFSIGTPYRDVAEPVWNLAHNADPGIRATVARALAKSRDPESIDLLRILVDDPLPRPRIAAARALGHIGGDAVVPALKKTLHDHDEAVRATAGGALARTISIARPDGKPLKKQ